MKNLSISFFATFVFFGMSVYSNVNAASNWTVPANPACEVTLGNATNIHSGFKASGGVAVISCDLTKKIGSNNLNYVNARINRKLSGGADPFCTLTSYSAFSTSNNSKWGYASNGAGNKYVGIPLPNLSNNGYLGMVCVLNNGDTLYGISYGQD